MYVCKYVCVLYHIAQMFGGRKLGKISHQNLLASKTWRIFCFYLSLFMSQDIVKIWMVKYGEPPVICQIHQKYSSAINLCCTVSFKYYFVCIFYNKCHKSTCNNT